MWYLLLIFGLLPNAYESKTLSKRRLDEFGAMIRVTTGQSSLDYNEYGNYCGLGGSGEPVDNIDKCCQTHDACYRRINRAECAALIKLKPYVESYKWENRAGTIVCTSTDDSCLQAACTCDKEGSECFGQHKSEYNRDNLRNIGKLLSNLEKIFASTDDACLQAACTCDKEGSVCFDQQKSEINRDNLRNLGKLLSNLGKIYGRK